MGLETKRLGTVTEPGGYWDVVARLPPLAAGWGRTALVHGFRD